MKLHYLGSGASEGFPAPFCECPACHRAREAGGRNHKMRSCALLEGRVLLDLSPDLVVQAQRFNLCLSRLSGLVVTHSHEDHLDLFSLALRGKDAASVRQDAGADHNRLEIYGSGAVCQKAEQSLVSTLGAEQFARRFRLHEVKPYGTFSCGGMEFTALPARHMPGESCHIYLVERGGERLLYANDTGRLEDEVFQFLKGRRLDVVSMDCARGPLPGDGHMGLEENREMKLRLREAGCADDRTHFYLNHFSHMGNVTHDEWQAVVDQDGFTVAWDGLELDVSSSASL